MHLRLQQFHSKKEDGKHKPVKGLNLPLYFDGNSSSIQVGDRNRAVSELGLDLPSQPAEFGDMEAEYSSGQDSDTDWDPAGKIPTRTGTRKTAILQAQFEGRR